MNRFVNNQVFLIITCFFVLFCTSNSSFSINEPEQLQQVTLTLIQMNEELVCKGGYSSNRKCPKLFDGQNINIEELVKKNPDDVNTIVINREQDCDFVLSKAFYSTLTSYLKSGLSKSSDPSKRKSILIVLEWEEKRVFGVTITRGLVESGNEHQTSINREPLYSHLVNNRTHILL